MSEINDFYRAFEDRMRGSRDLILERLQVYRPYLSGLLDLFQAPEALDIGCGRGEWLELLTELGFDASGIDLDEGMLAACHEKGMKVENGDGVEKLAVQADNSLALVSAFHVVEHIPFEQLQRLVKEAERVLRPGGLLILETPNPENPDVGGNSFYLDPTHEKPLPPGLLAFLPDYYGYYRTQVARLQEPKGLSREQRPSLTDVLLNASPDYAVIAQKQAEPEQLAMLDAPFQCEWGIDLRTLTQRYDQSQYRLRVEFEEKATARMSRQLEEYQRETEQRIGQLSAEVGQLSAELHGLYHSRSWRLTAPLRWLGAHWRALRHHGPVLSLKLLLYRPVLKLVRWADRHTRQNLALRRRLMSVLRTLGVYNRLVRFYHNARMRQAAEQMAKSGQHYSLTEHQKAARAAWLPDTGTLTTEELLERIRTEIHQARQKGDIQ